MLRPIDVTLTIKHAAEAVRGGSGDTHSGRPEVAQQMFADKLEKELREQEKQAREVTQAEKNEVTPDRKGDGSGYQRNRKRPDKKSLTKPEKHQGLGSESMYDIKV